MPHCIRAPARTRLRRPTFMKKFAGCGVGTSLLKVAVAMTRELARSIGVAALVVHPLNERATRFYLERGFVHAKAGKDLLVFPVSDPAV